ncbi:MAG: sulfatase [Blastocatellia bacterium]|nr:sulfatase [Blastocatellia bacterium]
MKRTFLVVPFILLMLCTVSAQSLRAPNIVLIYADDMGYGDLSSFGAKAIKTPNLDRMAAEGLKLTSFYSVSPVCTPSRAALMTGRYTARMGVQQMHLSNVLTFQDKTGLPTNETTMATALKSRGYATACIGKWHLGHLAPHRPIDHGFDYYFGIPYSNDMQPSMLKRMDDIIEQPVKQETLTQRYTEETIRFIEQNSRKQFFVYLPHNMPHIPLFASEKFKGKSAGGLYGDVVEELDWSVGEILAALKRLGVEKNTLVIFASDNGPWYQGSPGPLRGRKGWTYDGGVRVPGIVFWPGKIKARRVSDEPLATIDLFPTLLALAGETNGSKLPLDGNNAANFLLGKESKSPENLYLFFDKEFLQTVRFGKWKIHVARWNVQRYQFGAVNQINQILSTPELFDLSVDAGESYNQAARFPEVVADLKKRIAEKLKTFPDEIQKANAELLK